MSQMSKYWTAKCRPSGMMLTKVFFSRKKKTLCQELWAMWQMPVCTHIYRRYQRSSNCVMQAHYSIYTWPFVNTFRVISSVSTGSEILFLSWAAMLPYMTGSSVIGQNTWKANAGKVKQMAVNKAYDHRRMLSSAVVRAMVKRAVLHRATDYTS